MVRPLDKSAYLEKYFSYLIQIKRDILDMQIVCKDYQQTTKAWENYIINASLSNVSRNKTIEFKNSNIQGSSPYVVKGIFHAIRKGFAPSGSKFFPLIAVPIMKRDTIELKHCLIQSSPFDVRNFLSVAMPLDFIQNFVMHTNGHPCLLTHLYCPASQE